MTPKKSTPKKAAKKAVKKASPKKKAAKKASKKEAKVVTFSAPGHNVVPTHEALKEDEIVALFEQYAIQATNLPTIHFADPGLKGLDVKVGDIIRVIRPSITAGQSIFYRRVSNE